MTLSRAHVVMVVAAAVVGTAAVFAVTGGPSEGSADCGTEIKADGVVFVDAGATSRHAEAYGTALRSVCEDVGRNARGAVFTDDSRTLTTYRFAGYPAAEVLGVRSRGSGDFLIFVADTVSAHDREQIARELRGKAQRSRAQRGLTAPSNL